MGMRNLKINFENLLKNRLILQKMTLERARELDQQFPTYKEEFEIPTFKSLGISSEKFDELTPSVYFCGNSLGLMPKNTRVAINNELNAWGQRGVECHVSHPGENNGATPWIDIDLPLLPLIAPIVGGKENEVAVMGSLTSNLNALLMSFYKPKGKKTKILFEKQAFPSDYYAFLNVVKMFGYDEEHLIQVEVKQKKTHLETQDILTAIKDNHEELALVCFSGIQYYTGQFFNISKITEYAKTFDITVGWDLAHAVGNVPLKLHEWNVDFAAWCSYKYLNSGPGGIAGIFVHERHTKDISTDNFSPRLAGWWGNNASERFKMLEKFDPIKSALSYRQSNPSVIDVVSLKSSLEIFHRVGGIEKLRAKSIELTRFLQDLLTKSKYYLEQNEDSTKFGFKILTPLNEEERGCQLSILFQPHNDDPSQNIMERVNKYLNNHAIICDERRPDVLRFAPIPLYNTFEEVSIVVGRTLEAMATIE